MAQNSESIKPSIFFVANLMNFVLATGIFTLPFSLYESGIFLGSLILVTTCGLSIIACTFIIESLAIQNCFLKEESLVLNRASTERRISLGISNTENTYIFSEKVSSDSKELKHTDINSNSTSTVSMNEEEQDEFYIFKRIEISKLAYKVFNKPVYFYVVIVMICYLYVGLTSNAMIASKSLNSIISKSLDQSLPPYFYKILVSSFFGLVILLALNNINHLKKLRACIYSIIHNGMAKFSEIPKFDISHITVMIGNSLFLFMSHHSMPGMVENFKPQKNLIKLIVIAYTASLILMLLYGYISLLAFAQYTNCSTDIFPCAIQSTFSLNFISLRVAGFIINYYPLLNIITSSMLTITLKNNILQVIGNCSLSMYKTLNFTEQTGIKPLILSILFNSILCLPSLTAAIFLPDIQQLMKYFSSIFGFMIMIIIPTILVNEFRLKLKKSNIAPGKLNVAFLKKNSQLYIILCLGGVIFSLIIYGFFNSDNKTCVAQP